MYNTYIYIYTVISNKNIAYFWNCFRIEIIALGYRIFDKSNICELYFMEVRCIAPNIMFYNSLILHNN